MLDLKERKNRLDTSLIDPSPFLIWRTMFVFRTGFSHFVPPHAHLDNLTSFLSFLSARLFLPFLSLYFHTTECYAERRRTHHKKIEQKYLLRLIPVGLQRSTFCPPAHTSDFGQRCSVEGRSRESESTIAHASTVLSRLLVAQFQRFDLDFG